MKKAIYFAVLSGLSASYAHAQTTLGPATWTRAYTDTNSKAWYNPANWDTNAYPTGEGAIAIFNNETAGDRNFSLTPTGTTADPLPGNTNTPSITLGSLTVNNTTSKTNNFTSGTNSVFLDGAGSSPATISALGVATSTGVPTTFGAGFVFQSPVIFNVAKTLSTSASGDVNLSGIYTGANGFTKTGNGIATITNGANITKTFAGPTVVDAGRLRLGTLTGSPGVPLSNTSSVTINSGAQLDLGIVAGSYRFGVDNNTLININGLGLAPQPSPTADPANPVIALSGAAGSIRVFAAAGIATTVSNAINVQSDQASVMQARAGNILTLSGVIQGPGTNRFRVNPFGDASTNGIVLLTADNTYAGGTIVSQGTLRVASGADLGSGDVFVDGATFDVAGFGTDVTRTGLAAGKLNLQTSTAIADSAALNLTGDTVMFAGAIDGPNAIGGVAILDAGVSEQVGGLVLGGVTQTVAGTYGSTTSSATFKDDAYFSGAGVVNLSFTRTLYFDTNGETAGAGGTAPTGNWNGSTVSFNSDSTGGTAGTQTRTTLITDPVNFSAGTDATGSYTVNVSGTQSAASVTVARGNVTFAGGTINTGAFNVASGATGTVSSVVTGGATSTITKTGVGTLTLSGVNTHTGGTSVNDGTLVVANRGALGTGSLAVNTGGTARLQTDVAKTTALVIPSITTAGTGTLDITNNSIVIKSQSLSAVTALVQQGYGVNQDWTGSGITSSTAATDPNGLTAIGMSSNEDLGYDTFKGVTLGPSDIMVRYTYYGDSDLDGDTDLSDFNLFVAGFLNPAEAPPRWVYGDYDYSGTVDLTDFNLFVGVFLFSPTPTPLSELTDAIESSALSSAEQQLLIGAAQAAAVPEPTSLGLLGLGACGLLARRRRTA